MTSLKHRLEALRSAQFYSAEAAAAAQAALDGKTKPRGSLGRIEGLAVQLAGVRGDAALAPPSPAIVVFGADHGVATRGVSAYPQEVTRQMLLNYGAGGAAINVLARQHGAELLVADLGVVEALPEGSSVRDLRVGPGTQSFLDGPAMSLEAAARAIEAGLGVAADLAAVGRDLICIGEMGIGNTTAAAALTAAYCDRPAADVTGRGTGVDDAGLAQKIAVIDEALAHHRESFADPLATLAALGGFEIAGLAGVILGAAAHRLPILLDGFITGAAALAAVRLCPAIRPVLIASHRSVERGHGIQLAALDLEPLVELDLRLGEGSGAALVLPLLRSAVLLLREMATFASAEVTDTGR